MSIIIALLELSELDDLNGFTVTIFMIIPNMPSLIVIILASTPDWLSKSLLKRHCYPSFLAF
tara:strand:+ start:420 stop:605 length:186 start_codon:yes stop_codon:yes gene_type:complete